MSEKEKIDKRKIKKLIVAEPVEPEQYAYDLGSLGVPVNDVASRLDLAEDTFRRRYLVYYRMGLEQLTDRLRSVQIRVATGEADPEGKPNPGMLIWLGRQLLKQKDKQEVEHSSSKDNPMYFFPITRDYAPKTYEERKKDKNSSRCIEEKDQISS